jgi:hypothetical protein
MSTNLISVISQALTPTMVSSIASALNLDAATIEKAIRAAVPGFLSALVGVATQPEGARKLANAIASPAVAKAAGNIEGGVQASADAANSQLSALLGGNTLSALTSAIGRFAGMGEGSAKGLMGLLGPLVLNVLGKEQQKSGLDATGLANLLTTQKDSFAAALPAGVSNLLSGSGIMESIRGARAATAAAYDDAAARTSAGMTYAAQAVPQPASMHWAYWAIPLVAAIALLWYFLGGTTTEQTAEIPVPPERPTATTGLAPNLTMSDAEAGRYVTQVATTIDRLETSLRGITDPATATAAAIRIREMTGQLDRISALVSRMPPERRAAIANMIRESKPKFDQLIDKATANPDTAAAVKSAIDTLRARLNALTRA